MVDTLDSKYGILEKLDRIEDKVLELKAPNPAV